MIEIYLPGTTVHTAISNIEAKIVQAAIQSTQYVQYQIGYFSEGKYETAWLSEFEFTVTGAKSKIGFKQ